jgi:hypothetical protein
MNYSKLAALCALSVIVSVCVTLRNQLELTHLHVQYISTTSSVSAPYPGCASACRIDSGYDGKAGINGNVGPVGLEGIAGENPWILVNVSHNGGPRDGDVLRMYRGVATWEAQANYDEEDEFTCSFSAFPVFVTSGGGVSSGLIGSEWKYSKTTGANITVEPCPADRTGTGNVNSVIELAPSNVQTSYAAITYGAASVNFADRRWTFTFRIRVPVSGTPSSSTFRFGIGPKAGVGYVYATPANVGAGITVQISTTAGLSLFVSDGVQTVVSTQPFTTLDWATFTLVSMPRESVTLNVTYRDLRPSTFIRMSSQNALLLNDNSFTGAAGFVFVDGPGVDEFTAQLDHYTQRGALSSTMLTG